ncbi:MAG TPA: FG-GAP-like repeat-containing protein, partial [Vicinamibacteria bacterium]|nr:FG-GAP-like repeat-containing protein [Vicinamibacteria bacterium]
MKPKPAALAVLCLLGAVAPAGAVVNPPVLKWQGPCGSFCQTGWYSSPAVADLDGDGNPEVIWGAYDLFVYQGSSGALRARSANPQRVWPGVAVADLGGDGTKEIVVGRGQNQLHVYRFVPPSTLQVVWSRNPFANNCAGNNCEVRTLAVEDLESDGSLEVVVGRASGGDTEQLNAYDANGNQRPGWPARHTGEVGYGWGMYNENVTIGDLNNDGLKEVIGPTDTHYIAGLDRNGNQLPTHAMFNTFNPAGPKPWARVGVHVDLAADLRGYANCGAEHRPNFANSAPAIADMDGDGTREIVVPGDVYNCDIGDPEGDLYHLPWILKMDRSRWAGSGFDWTVLPTAEPGSGPVSQDYSVIENSVQNAVLADLDNDGRLEILIPSYDGRLHAWWLDKTEHGAWPFDVPGSGIRFASEPAVADLDNDGQAEVIFTSWGQKAGNTLGQLHIVSSQGVQLQAVNLPAPSSAIWNGGLAAPTLANIDGDADLEVVVGTSHTGVIAYDLPGTANARVLWGTGRGNYQRTGALPAIPPAASIADATVTEGNAGNTPATFGVTLSRPSGVPVTIVFATSAGTATAGVDYGSTSGVVTFPPGTVARTVTVPVVGDLMDEPNET